MKPTFPDFGWSDEGAELSEIVRLAWDFHEAARKYLRHDWGPSRAELPGFPKDMAELVYVAAEALRDATIEFCMFASHEDLIQSRSVKWLDNLVRDFMLRAGWLRLDRHARHWRLSRPRGGLKFNPDPLIDRKTLRSIREALQDLGVRFPKPRRGRLAVPSQSSEPPPAPQGIPKRKSDDSTEARDAWLYDHYVSDVSLDEIIKLLRDIASQNGWAEIDTESGVTRAAQRFAERNGLPKPKKGQGINHRSTPPNGN